MIVQTKIFELYNENYRNLAEVACAMGISVSQIYRVRQGARHINQKFIIGALQAFPGHKFDDLFYFTPAPTPNPSRIHTDPEARSPRRLQQLTLT